MGLDAKVEAAVFELLDRQAIYEALCKYARGVDRGDWELVRSTYHPDANDDHVDFRGCVDELVIWLEKRFRGVDNSSHFLGNCLIEFAGRDKALVETYFVSSRLRADVEHSGTRVSGGVSCRQSWGRYVDLFERREGEWRVASRKVVIEQRFTSAVSDGSRAPGAYWGLRSTGDRLYLEQAKLGLRQEP